MKKLSIDETSSLLGGDIQAFGYRLLGPYLVAFCAWLRERKSEAAQDACLLFVARDGYLPHLVYRTLYPEESASCSYVLASRVATQLADLQRELNVTTWLGTRKVRRTPAVANYFRDSVREDSGGPLDGSNSASFQKRVAAQSLNHNLLYRSYLAEIVSSRYPIVVDIGYQARIQSFFSRALGRSVAGMYLVTHEMARRVARNAGPVFAFDAEFIPTHSETSFVNRHRYLFEAVLSEPQGTFLFFNSQGRPQFEPFSANARSVSIVAEIRKGVERYAREVRAKLVDTEATSHAARDLRMFLENPHPEDAALFAGLSFEDRLKGAQHRYIISPEAECRTSYALWIQGQQAINIAGDNEHLRKRKSMLERIESNVMKGLLTNSNFACYTTNRALYISENGGVPEIYRRAVVKWLGRRVSSR
ncbi:hypothetical protein [Sinorhizobium fredii]|uniref:hypothetical protein n=1 Tax=Rhizobium fredii TaxID=380 RepID=UPI00210B7F3A|nr:hypothetical protein [Sinorhizobium fredii]UTY46694.1 hypothetical protein EPK84_07455 [Sinorhizobium fredii]